MEKFIETREVPCIGEYDIIIAGGGIAGVAAALAARRLGSKVLLIEKSVMLGGLATLGLISWYEPLCDGSGRHIIKEFPKNSYYCPFNTVPMTCLLIGKTEKKRGLQVTKVRNSLFSYYLRPCP